MAKYTVYGDSDFDQKIDSDMKLIEKLVLDNMPCGVVRSIILAGGYGRGEGGTRIIDGKMCLYNDYDMFLISENISSQKKKECTAILYEVSEQLTEKIGVDVDFGPIFMERDLSSLPYVMMFYDLKYGSTVIYGDTAITNKMPDYPHYHMDIEESVNLLLNRGVGLILSRKKLNKYQGEEIPPGEDYDFIERNIYKALMAAGDSILIEKNKYHYSYVQRLESSVEINSSNVPVDKDELRKLYEASINYKLKPEKYDGDILELYNEALKLYKEVYYYILSLYLGVDVKNCNSCYVSGLIKKYRENNTFFKLLKNAALNVKFAGFKCFNLKLYLCYPRLRLLLVLPYFLFNESKDNYFLSKTLSLPSDLPNEEYYSKFITLWKRFN